MRRGLPTHPKLTQLASALSVSKAQAIGHIELLWHFAARHTPQGDLGKYQDQWIEAALDWAGAPGRLLEAMVETGWIKRDPVYRYVIADWRQHADAAVRRRLRRLNLPFIGDSSNGLALVRPKPKSKQNSKPDASILFESWWECVWAKTGKLCAAKAFPKALEYVQRTQQCSAEKALDFLRDKALRERENCTVPGHEWRERLHPSTWLNGRRWEDVINPKRHLDRRAAQTEMWERLSQD